MSVADCAQDLAFPFRVTNRASGQRRLTTFANSTQ